MRPKQVSTPSPSIAAGNGCRRSVFQRWRTCGPGARREEASDGSLDNPVSPQGSESRTARPLRGFRRGRGAAAAGPAYCTTQGNRTYCDDGRAYYRYGNDIVSKDGRRWHDFGKHVYGPDGDWIAKHGKKGMTSSLRSGPGDEAAILPRILERDDADSSDGDDGGDD